MPERSNSTPLLLLPGMMCDAALWQPQVQALAEERAITVADFSNAASITEMAERARHLMGSEKHAVAGLSMGGIVAFELWRHVPELIAGLALLDTNHLPDAADRREVRANQMQKAEQGLLYWLIRDELKPAYRAPHREPDAAVMDTIMAMGLRQGPQSFIAQSIALRDRVDSSLTLNTIDQPTLVLCGAEDALCPVERHRMMADAIPDNELVVVPDCGHLTTLEQPAAVTRAMRQWLIRVDQHPLEPSSLVASSVH